MSKAGQNTFKGINTQAKASLLLFLMNLQNSGFNRVILEDEKWEDFTLIFNAGKKIICESKDRSRELSWSNTRSILQNISEKPGLSQDDEILIICRSVTKELESGIQYLKYDFPDIVQRYKDHHFTDEQIALLSRTKFFYIEDDEFLYQQAIAYFSEQVSYWVPEKDLEMFMDSILIHEIYNKSERGKEFTKKQLQEAIDTYKQRKIKDSYAYDPERKSLEDRIKTQLNGVSDTTQRDRILNASALTAITAQPNLGFFLLEYIRKLHDVHLEELDELWSACLKRLYAFTVLLIFEKQIDNPNNASYILRFLAKNYISLTHPVRDAALNNEFAVELILKIYNKYPDLSAGVFVFVKNVLEARDDEYTKLDSKRDINREREFISELLYMLFSSFKGKNNYRGMKDIIGLVYKHFDLVSDDSRHNLFTPDHVFMVVKEYIGLDFKNNLRPFIKQIVSQYKKREWYKKFNGWELSGGGISQSGNSFSITDRHFVNLILVPIFKEYYEENKTEAWNFILSNIARKISDVSSTKPDFINRAAIPVIFEEYRAGNNKTNAYEILCDFVKMRKGIPWKADLIFQELTGNYSPSQKWDLVNVSLQAYKDLPVNVFVEQIVSGLAADSEDRDIQTKAIDTLKRWAKNPEYAKRHITESFNLIHNISNLLNGQDNPETFSAAVSIFKELINSKDFIKKDNSWKTWDVANVLTRIMTKDPEEGIGILAQINKKKKLSFNEETLICHSINGVPKENKELLLRAYKEFVSPMLTSLGNDISKIESRIQHRHAREQLVQYAEKLAEARYFKESLSIVKVFVKDSDPILGNYDDDKKGDFNYHQKIIEGDDNPTLSTVRGYCAWVLQKFTTLHGREFIPEIIPLVEKLTKDPNYYVRAQSCIPLMELAKNRNSVMPDNSKERFISVELAEKIENIAFEMLEDEDNHKLPAVMKHLAMVFNYMRTIKQEKAMKVLQIFLMDEYPDKVKERGRDSYLADVLSAAAPLYIFFAEFREKSFKDWPANWPNLGDFDPNPFKKLLESLMHSEDAEIRNIFSWQLARLPEEVKGRPEFDSVLKMTAKYLEFATDKYEHRTFENIYRFVEDYIFNDDYFNVCFDLWTKCILTEAEYFKSNFSKDNFHEMYWWPFFYNGKILMEIAKKKGEVEFLKWLGILVDYPTDMLIANDLDIAVDYLTQIRGHNDEIEILFQKLMERNAKYFEFKERWLDTLKN